MTMDAKARQRQSVAPIIRTQTNAFKIIQKNFPIENQTKAINLLCYGVDVVKLSKQGKKPIQWLIYISEDDPQYLQYFTEAKNYSDQKVALHDIYEIKEKPTNEKFKNVKIEKIIQISYDDSNKVFEFKSQIQRDLWWQGLQYFIDEAIKQQSMVKSQDFTKFIGNKMFQLGGAEQDQSLNFTQIKKLILQMNVQIPDVKLLAIFNLHDADRTGTINNEEFHNIVKEIVNYDDLKPLYINHALYSRGLPQIQQLGKKIFTDEEGLMSKYDLHYFITQTQKQPITQMELNRYFEQFAKKSIEFSSQKLISFQKFTQFLMNPLNSAFDTEKQIIYQNMTRPLTDYYINSSHNTYLMSNQLTGQSSIQAYINAFQKGCRCVELDCWDGTNGQPIIYHGYTMTTKITFESVIKTIKEYAFKYSPYPLILSLEVHCTIEQQDIMADIMKEYLDDLIMLVHADWNETNFYPSPFELIILKGKGKIQLGLDYRLGQNESKSDSGNDQDEDDCSQRSNDGQLQKAVTFIDEVKEIKLKPILKRRKTVSQSQFDLSQSENEDSNQNQIKFLNIDIIQVSLRPKYKNNQVQLTNLDQTLPQNQIILTQLEQSEPDYEDQKIIESVKHVKEKDSIKLVAITSLYGIQISLIKERSVWEISSLDETKLQKLFKTNEKSLVDFHRKHFTRIYPGGQRVDSSNYDPIPSYNAGSQIIALNFQTLDMPMLLNFCKFQENGGLEGGYLLKPEWMLHDTDNPRIPSDFKTIIRTIDIHLICGQNLNVEGQTNQNAINPFVKITLRGISSDEQQNPSTRSLKIQNSSLNPKFDFKCKFQICCIDLAVIVFEVFDEDMMQNKFSGWTAIPVTCLRQGLRNIQLMNRFFKPIQNSFLFALIEFDQQL